MMPLFTPAEYTTRGCKFFTKTTNIMYKTASSLFNVVQATYMILTARIKSNKLCALAYTFISG